AVILDASIPITGLADSKALSESRRTHIANDIRDKSLAWSIAWADAAEIDAINILQATFLAMRRALLGLRVIPGLAEIDGNRLPNLDFDGQSIKGAAIVRGDASVPAISACGICTEITPNMVSTSTRATVRRFIATVSSAWDHVQSIAARFDLFR
ncbi:MAG: hypothetical protein HOM16_06925, partial [Woeseia sp.]|nr:hypothetical protein [Woeseia sp.]